MSSPNSSPSLSCNSINLICSELQSLSDSILSSSTGSLPSSELFPKFALKLIQLKQLNRYILTKLEAQKVFVEQRKEQVGNSQLALENLLYKQSYLLREISLCQNDQIPHIQAIEQNLLNSSTQQTSSSAGSSTIPSHSILISTYDQNLKSNHKLSLEKLHSEYQKRKSLIQSIHQKEVILNSKQELLQKKRKLIDTFPAKVQALQLLANEVNELFPKSNQVDSGNVLDGTLDLSKNLPTSLFLIFRSFYSATLDSSEMNLNIVSNPEPLQAYTGSWAIELTFTQSMSAPGAGAGAGGSNSSQAQATYVLRYHQRLNLVLVSVSNLSIAGTPSSKPLPFKKTDWSRCLLPSHLRSSAYFSGILEPGLGEPEMWAQWLGGLRPLPSPGTELPFLSTASLINLMQSRLKSLWRLSYSLSFLNDLQSLPTFSAALPSAVLKRSLSDLSHQSTVRLQGVTTISPVNDPFEFCSSSSSLSTPTAPAAASSSSGVSQQNASAPVVAEDLMERCPVMRNPEEILGSIYYQLEFLLTSSASSSGSDQSQSLFAILEIPATYPLRTPQILLTPRSNSSAPSTQCYSHVTTLRAIEQEVNAGCLLFFENCPELLMNNEHVEGALDSILSIQLSTLFSLLSSGATFDHSSNAPPAGAGAVIGKNRSSKVLSKMYGRHFNGTA